MHMLKTIITIIALLLTLAGMLALFYYLRKIEKRNHLVTTHESLLHWQDVKCAQCKLILIDHSKMIRVKKAPQ